MPDPAMPDSAKPDSPAVMARKLVRTRGQGALATLLGPGAAPYASLVLAAFDHDASPILLISQLAEHTRNIQADARASLLFGATDGLEDPLTGPRVTLVGRFEPAGEPRHRARFLARHPSAAFYADFKDFGFYRMAVERAHLVAGFGRIHWIAGADFLFGGPFAPLAEAEGDIVAHMNADHREALDLYANGLARLPQKGWSMTGCDPEGADLRLGAHLARVIFERPVADAEGARAALVALARRARAGRPGDDSAVRTG